MTPSSPPTELYDRTVFMDNQITNMAMSLKSILQSSFSKRKLEYEDTIISQQYQDNKSSTDSHETDVIYSSPLMKKRCLSSSENNPHQHEHQVLEFSNPTEVALNYFSEEKDSNPTATYESAVMKYRQLRNEIPLLTGAAYDVDAATTELNDHINYVEIASSNGPLIKRPPPGRGRRSALSIINTPLPYQVSENLKNYKKTKLHRTPFEEKRQCRILFIDDSLVTLRLTAKRLQNAGFNVETSTNGIDALNILKGEGNNQRYDIVLADINMPIMNGTEVAIALREHESNIKKSGGTIHRQFFIGTSCETGNHISDTALAAGMDVFLAKPFTPSDLQLFIQPHTRYHENH